MINTWLGTQYSLEEVAEMDDLLFEMLGAVRRGMEPPKKK